MVAGWVPVRRRRALGGEAVARPSRGAFRSADTLLAGGGSLSGGLDGQWAAPCSGGPFASMFIAAAAYGAASAAALWSEADDRVRWPPAFGGQAWGGEGGGGLLGYAGSRPASR
jgi:hypothetical protein